MSEQCAYFFMQTTRLSFIKKCNYMLEYFGTNTLKLNLEKSGYLFINGKSIDWQNTIDLTSGLLEYKRNIVYLGVIVSDKGSINK